MAAAPWTEQQQEYTESPEILALEAVLTGDIVEPVRQYGRYGYRKIAELLLATAGWVVNDKPDYPG